VLNAEQAKLELDYQDADELPDEVDQRLSEIETALMAFDERSIVFDPIDISRAGVFISIDSERRLSVDRGYVRPEDEAPREDPTIRGVDASSSEVQEVDSSGVQRTAISVAGSAPDSEDDDEDAARPLPDRLIIELTAHRTLALRDELAENPAITFQAVLHNFVLTAFYRFASSGSCLEIGLRTPTFPAQAPGLRDARRRKPSKRGMSPGKHDCPRTRRTSGVR
jgi:ParB family chromosome partitioning protein